MVQLCTRDNETYAVLNLNSEVLLQIKGKRLIGAAGRTIDKLFTRDLEKRRCKLVGEYDLGQEYPNGSWSGNIGLLQRHEAGAYLKTESPLVQASWLGMSHPVLTEQFKIFEILKPEQNHDFNLMQNLNFGFQTTSCFIMASCFSFVFIFILITIRKKIISAGQVVEKSRLRRGAFNLVKAASNYMKFSERFASTLTSVGIFIMFFDLFLWLFMVFVLNTTKTNKVVIDTSEIIKDTDDAMNTERVCCLLEDDTEYKIAMLSKDNQIRKLLDSKFLEKPLEGFVAKSGRCLLSKADTTANVDATAFYSILGEQSAFASIILLSGLKEDWKIWISSIPVYEQNLHIYHVMDDDIIQDYSYSYSESGLFLSQIDALRNDALFEFNKRNRLYFRIQEYEEDVTKFDNLSFGNFRMLFVFTHSVYLLLFLVFIIHHIVLKVCRRWQRGRRRKRRGRFPHTNVGKVLTRRRLRVESLFDDPENTRRFQDVSRNNEDTQRETQYRLPNLNGESSGMGRTNEQSSLQVQTLKTQVQVHPSPAS